VHNGSSGGRHAIGLRSRKSVSSSGQHGAPAAATLPSAALLPPMPSAAPPSAAPPSAAGAGRPIESELIGVVGEFAQPRAFTGQGSAAENRRECPPSAEAPSAAAGGGRLIDSALIWLSATCRNWSLAQRRSDDGSVVSWLPVRRRRRSRGAPAKYASSRSVSRLLCASTTSTVSGGSVGSSTRLLL
jgi:hypothetical protein